MEVNRKQLHKHAVPIILLLLSFSLISAGCYGYYSHANLNDAAEVGRGLVTQMVHIQHGSNGLGHVTLGTEQNQATVNEATSAGQGTNFSLTFGSNQ